MRITGTAKRLRIYIGDSDRWHHQPLALAILELLKREGLAGATVFQGVAGFGAHSRIHTRALLDLSVDLPVVIEVVDRPDRIDRILPLVEAMVSEGLITEEDVTVRVYRHRELKPLTSRLLVRDLMTREVIAVPPTATLAEVVARLSDQLFRALPVVDEDGRVVGIVTNDDLTERGGLPARPRLLRATVEGEPIPAGVAGDIMTREPVTIREDRPAAEALHLLASRGLKRLPVVDADGRLVGMLSRVDLLRAVDDGYTGVVGDAATRRVRGTVVADVMRRDPATVGPETPVPEVIDALLAAPTRRVLVTDEEGRLLGLISDADIVARLEPAQQPGLLAWLTGRSDEARQVQALSRLRAEDVMNRQVITIGPEATLEAAIARALDTRRHLLPVIDEQGRLLGLVSRAEMLTALTLAATDGELTGEEET
jgi:CBS-domain-containing membrane protein